MKILEISNTDIQYKQKLREYKHNIVPVGGICGSELTRNSANIYPYYFNMPVFKKKCEIPDSDIHLTKIQLLNSGYETAKIQNNKLINYGKHIILQDIDDIKALSQTPGAWKKEFILTDDIDMKGEKITGIGSIKKAFGGIFNGNGHTISNLEIESPFGGNIGFFKICDNADIKNLTLKNVKVKGKQNVGGLAGSIENNTILKNVSVSGEIFGENEIGGIVGNCYDSVIEKSSFDGKIQSLSDITVVDDDIDFFAEHYKPANFTTYGGIAGYASNSDIRECKAISDISGERNIGGIAGELISTKIQDCVCEAKIKGDKNIGIAAGKAENSRIGKCYFDTELPYFGNGYNCSAENCVSNIRQLIENVHLGWDDGIWLLEKRRIPRLKFDAEKIPAKSLFLQDINSDVLTGNISIKEIHYTSPTHIEIPLSDMEPPKHCPENERILDEINNCTSSMRLSSMFTYWTNSFRTGYNPENKECDEILLALVKNPNFNISKRILSPKYALFIDAAAFCTPLYVLSCLNKGYVFNEALKRPDIDPFKQNGLYKDTDMFDALCRCPITTNMVQLFFSDNPIVQNYVNTRLNSGYSYYSYDKITSLLIKNNRSKIEYDRTNNVLKVPVELFEDKKTESIDFRANDKFNTVYDVLKSPDIPVDYQDIAGNTIAHILPFMSQSEQLVIMQEFLLNRGSINMQNKKHQTPFQIALEQKQHDLYTFIALNKPLDAFNRDSDGNDALMLNVKYNKNGNMFFNADKLHNAGFSVNTFDNNNSTPLIEAIKNNNNGLINYLISNGADVNSVDSNGQTALHHAFINKNPLVIKWLLDKYAYPAVKDNLGLLPEDYWKDGKNILSASGIDIDSIKDEYKISLNVENIGPDVLQNGNISKSNIIKEAAVEYSESDAIAKIIKYCKNSGELYTAICERKDELIKNKQYASDIAELIVNINDSYTLEIFEKLIKSKLLDVNSKCKSGDSLLTTALKKYNNTDLIAEKLNYMRTVKFLLDNNADVDITDNNKQSSLHHAVFTQNIILFNEILGKHPNINATDLLGKSPIFYLGNDILNPMRIVFEKYAEKRGIAIKSAISKLAGII